MSFAPSITLSSPVHYSGRVVGEGGLVRGFNEFPDMKIRVPLEALVGEKFHHLLKCEFSLDIFRRASSLDGVVSSLGDRVQKPVNPLFFGGRVAGVVVGKLSDQFFVEVNVCCYVRAVDMS